MRLIGAILALLLASGPAIAQQPKQKGAPAAQGPAQVYAAMTEAERIAIQTDLIWAGDFNGVASGNFEARSLAAVRAFQKRNGGRETGILNPQERVALATASKAAQERAGWRIVNDPVTGARLGIPGRYVPQSAPVKSGTRWTSQQGQVVVETFRVREPGTTLAGVFEQQKKEPNDRKVTYNVIRPEFFVVSGLQGLKKFYVRAEFRNGEVRGMTVLYDQAMDGMMEPVVIAMSSAFTAFPSAVAAPAGPLPKPKVEYGTGIVVSTEGHIIADRQLIDDCRIVVVAGRGDAEQVAEDKAANLSLLRIHGGSDFSPLPLAVDAALRGSDLTLLGIADPQAQSGGSAVSRATARLTGQAIEPAPPPGFAGAAAIDAQGRVVGMVELRPQAGAGAPAAGSRQAVFVPADTLRKFLAANHAPLASEAPANVNASVVRIICVRK